MVQGLRLRGVDLITAYEDGADEIDDDELLDRATSLGRALFSNAALPPASGVLMPGRCGLLFTGLSRDSEDLVGLQAQAPLRVLEAVAHGGRGVGSRGRRRRAAGAGSARKSRSAKRSGSAPGCGNTSFSSSPERSTRSAFAFGLRQIQSTPAGGSRVPLVSMATSKPASWSAATSGSSSCSNGSPPVHTTNGRPRRRGGPRLADRGGERGGSREPAAARTVGADEIGVAPRRAGTGPFARSSSRPVHRLQPAKRRNTAGRPAGRPRPEACSRSP